MKKNDWLQLEDCPPSLLHTLVAFADQGSVSKAAAALGLDQPVVSRRLKVFIDRHPSTDGLLERVGVRRLRLTERGQALLPKVREVLLRYDDLLAHLRGRQQAQEVVRVAVGSFAAQLYLPQVLAEVGRQEVWRLETRLVRGRERILGVAEGRFDLALVTHAREDVLDLSTARQPLTIESLARHTVVVIAHPDTVTGQELNALPEERSVPLEQLARWPLVGLDAQSGLRRKLEQHLQGRVKLRYALEGQPGGWAIAREYARYQQGAALLPLPLLTPQDREDFVVRHLSKAFVIEDFFVSRAGDRTPVQAEAIDSFRQVAKGLTQENRWQGRQKVSGTD